MTGKPANLEWRMPAHLRGAVLILVAALCWATIGGWSRWAQGSVSVLEVAFWRAALASLLFALQAGLRGRLWPGAPGAAGRHALFGLLAVGVFYASFQGAVAEGGIILANVLLYTAPAWVAILAWPLLGVRPEKAAWTRVGVSLAGVALVATAGGGTVIIGGLGVALGLIAGLSYASYYIYGKLTSGEHPETLMAWASLSGAVVLGLLVATTGPGFQAPDQSGWMALVGLALFGTLIPLNAYLVGLRHLDAARAAVIATIEPVAAAALAYYLFGELLGPAGWVGAALVIAAGASAALSQPTGGAGAGGKGRPARI